MRGLSHLSASSLNSYIANPGAWVASYLLKRRDPSAPPMWAGTAAEDGLATWLRTGDEDSAHEACSVSFAAGSEAESFGYPDDKVDAARSLAHGALTRLMRFYKPTDFVRGEKIELRIDGCPLPIIGYTDFRWPERGVITDLKVTSYVPSEPKPEHIRQFAIYATATGLPQEVHYTSAKREDVFKISEAQVRDAMLEVRQAAKSLCKLLSLDMSNEELLSLFPAGACSFRADWGPETRAARWELA